MHQSGVYQKGELDLLDELRGTLRSEISSDMGALMVFLGIARQEGKSKKQVVKLVMESYEEHANKAIAKICEEVEKKFKVSIVSIHHLLGEFRVGEPIVLVVVGGSRRKNVFLAIQEAVERYKTEPALFKKEVYLNGAHAWIY